MHDAPLITTIAMAFSAAWVLGLLTQRLGLSPIVGYLLAGVAIGPYTPGFHGDVHIASQLAEIGVILLMFGVGLHFHLKDLLNVRNVAIPGAVGQSLFATILGVGVALLCGWGFKTGLVVGMAMSVASTVVLMRVLMDSRMLDTTHGHVAVGWLIVEDVLTVIVLVLIPVMGGTAEGSLWWTVTLALLKLSIFIGVMLVFGPRIIPRVMVWVARLRSRELFTLTVLVMAIAIATGAYYLFGASMALGAFIAGIVVGQSTVSQQAAADALPMRDAFAVLFFASVGMLFDPKFLIQHPGLLVAGLAIVMIGKPLAALVIVALIGYPARTAITVALGLAQIGEFSFIVAAAGRHADLLDDRGQHLLIATALVTLTLNPIIFRALPQVENLLKSLPWAWNALNFRTRRREHAINEAVGQKLESGETPLAVIIGYGPVGQTVDGILRDSGRETVVVDLNLDTVQAINRQGRAAIYGDAYNIEIMHQAFPRATHLIITLPHSTNRTPLIAAAKLINPAIKIFVRARYLNEREELAQAGADAACFEEAEAAVALSRLVLADQGKDAGTVRRETLRIRRDFNVLS